MRSYSYHKNKYRRVHHFTKNNSVSNILIGITITVHVLFFLTILYGYFWSI